MLGNWFKPGNEKKSSDNEPAAGTHPVSSGTQPNVSQPYPESGPTLEYEAMTAISNPHDAALAELVPQRAELDPSARPNEVPETSAIKDEDVTSEGHHRARSPHHEPLHDPFTGSIFGFAIPEEREQEDVDFESTKDELWTHMAYIREVQSQIANMHVLMEGIGLGPQGEQGTTGRSVPFIPSSEGDKWEDEEQDEEAEEKKAREQEFAKLAEKFNGRREATDNIMNKLDELSQVVTTFHALRTPTVDYNGSRYNTKDSTLSSPTGDSDHPALSDPPTVGMPPPQKSPSQNPFIESPVSINIDRPLPDTHPLASKLPSSR